MQSRESRKLIKADPHSKVPPIPIRKADEFGNLIVISPRWKRDGIYVHTCQCRCGSANCPTHADFEEAFLHNPANFPETKCFFAGVSDFVNFADLQAAVRSLKIKSQSSYKTALSRGALPKGSPTDPTVRPEWTSWADFVGEPQYRSREELSASLSKLDLAGFALIPELERYRFLAHQDYWTALEARAKEKGLSAVDLINNPELLKTLMGGDDEAEAPIKLSSVGFSGSSPYTPRPRIQPSLDLEHLRSRMEWATKSFHSTDQEVLDEVMTGWLHELWNKFDEFGAETFVRDFLMPIERTGGETCLALTKKFREQLRQVSDYKVKGRNWMQAYSLWYSTKNRRWINWSEPGLGKTRTVSAIAAEFDLRLTVFIAPMRIIKKSNPQFAFEAFCEDDRAKIHYSEDPLPAKLEPGYHHYILLNPTLFQLGDRSRRMVNRLLAMNPDMVIIDEAHLISSKDGISEDETLFEVGPRTRELSRFTASLPETTRIGLLTGTPIRTSTLEAQSLMALLGIDCEPISEGSLSYIHAFSLRAKLQQYGFRFYNYNLPRFEQYLVPFDLPAEVAAQINAPGRTYLENESIRIPYALAAIKKAKQRTLHKIENGQFVATRIDFDPIRDATNPVFFTTYVTGPVESIQEDLKKTGIKAYACTGESDDQEYADYLANHDGALIASQTFATGLNGAHKVSDTLITLGMPWTYTSHKQLIMRLVRQGAISASTGEVPVIREFIPVAKNAGYDVRRFMTVYGRREFSDCLLDGKVAEEMKRPESELRAAFLSVIGETSNETANEELICAA